MTYAFDSYKGGCLYVRNFIRDIETFPPEQQEILLSGGSVIDYDGDEISISIE